jgi:hypothetical protein
LDELELLYEDLLSAVKRFHSAEMTISGIELAEKIRKQQFKTGNLPGRPATAPDIWAAILADWLHREFFSDTHHVRWQSLHQNRMNHS